MGLIDGLVGGVRLIRAAGRWWRRRRRWWRWIRDLSTINSSNRPSVSWSSSHRSLPAWWPPPATRPALCRASSVTLPHRPLLLPPCMEEPARRSSPQRPQAPYSLRSRQQRHHHHFYLLKLCHNAVQWYSLWAKDTRLIWALAVSK